MKHPGIYLLAALMFLAFTSQAQKKKAEDLIAFKAQLTESVELPPACGKYAYAVAHKFRVIEAFGEHYKEKFVVIITPCPERKGKDFFKAGSKYHISAADNSGAGFSYSVINQYEREHIPTFWVREMIPMSE